MSSFRERAAQDIEARGEDPGVLPLMRQLVVDSHAMLSRAPADAAQRAQDARTHAVDNMARLHAEVREKLAERSIGYHRAASAEDAVAIVELLLGSAKRVAKSKSMVAEEVGLTHALRNARIDVLETDIGEYIVDVDGRGPSHITAPALHLNRARIRELLNRTGASLDTDDPEQLSRYVRDVVGDYFTRCDAAITGANAVIASSGRIAIVENEGNVALGVSHPRLHIVITGIEKVVADEAGALSVLEVLAANATAQPLTAFTHFLGEPLPGQERHVVFVDHGRSAIAADRRYRDALRCIRCGACMNTCPVYRAAGGLSFGSPYMGPIGAVISPLLWRDGRADDLPFASSLCGACTEICPVGIPLHRMLLDLRGDAVEDHRAGNRVERAAWAMWARSLGSGRRGRMAERFARIGIKAAGLAPGFGRLVGKRLPRSGARHSLDMLRASAPQAEPKPTTVPPAIPDTGLPDLFRARAGLLGVTIAEQATLQEGDRRLKATAAIASTGSVVLTGEMANRRELLAARRVVVDLDPATIVEYPHQVEPYLGDGDALILTGASRTADIEKKIVRGIHGSEELVVVMGEGEAERRGS